MARYTRADDIIGQFVPRVRTRRITLEDGQNSEIDYSDFELQPYRATDGSEQQRFYDRQREEFERNAPRRNLSYNFDQTIVTVDFNVKELLTETTVETFSQNLNRGVTGESFRNLITDCLQVYVLAFSSKQVASQFYKFLSTVHRLASLGESSEGYGWENGDTFETFLPKLIRKTLNSMGLGHVSDERAYRNSGPIPVRKVDRYEDRFTEEQFRRTGTQYQAYDSNNSVMEILPGRHVFQIDDLGFNNCDNLNIVTFANFDFQVMVDYFIDSGVGFSLPPDIFTSFSAMVSQPTLDVVTESGKIRSTAAVFLDKITRAPYNGPLHTMEGGGYMTGFLHSNESREIELVQVPVTKIQDFRILQRSRLINFEPPTFDSYSNRIPNQSFLETRHKNHFDLAGVMVDYLKDTRITRLTWAIGLESIYKNNSRYYDFMNTYQSTLPADQRRMEIVNLLDIKSVRVLRKRVTVRDVGTNRLGAGKKKDFMDLEEPVFSVVYRTNEESSGPITDNTMGRNQTNTVQRTEDGSRIRHRGLGAPMRPHLSLNNAWMDFYAADYSDSLRQYHGTGVVLQYGVELVFVDRTKEVMESFLEECRAAITNLETISARLKVPTFTIDGNQAVSSVGVGYYDYGTNSFVNNPESVFPGADQITHVLYFMDLWYITFATGHSITRSSVNILQRDDMDSFNNYLALETLIEAGEIPDFGDMFDIFLNMINPRNSNPELFDSFIKHFKDTLESVEGAFDFQDYNNPDAIYGGAGYTAKGNNHFTVQRWFNNPAAHNDIAPNGTLVDDDNYVYMDPDESSLFYNYDPPPSHIDPSSTNILLENVGFTVNEGADSGGEFELAGVTANSVQFGGTRFVFQDMSPGETQQNPDEGADIEYEATPGSGTGMYEGLNGLIQQITIATNSGRDVTDVINAVDSAASNGEDHRGMIQVIGSLTEEITDNGLTPTITTVQTSFGDLCDIKDNTPPNETQFAIDVLPDPPSLQPSIEQVPRFGFVDGSAAGMEQMDMRMDSLRMLGVAGQNGIEPLPANMEIQGGSEYQLLDMPIPALATVSQAATAVVTNSQVSLVGSTQNTGMNTITGGAGDDTITITGGAGDDTITGGVDMRATAVRTNSQVSLVSGGSSDTMTRAVSVKPGQGQLGIGSRNFESSQTLSLSKTAASSNTMINRSIVKKGKKTFNTLGQGAEPGRTATGGILSPVVSTTSGVADRSVPQVGPTFNGRNGGSVTSPPVQNRVSLPSAGRITNIRSVGSMGGGY